MFQFTEVALCKNSVADQIGYKGSSHIKRTVAGDLEILLETTTGMMMLKMKDFQYGINPNDEILFEDRDPQWKLMLCLDSNPENAWVLKINDNIELVFFIISQRCKLIHRKAAKRIVQGEKKEMIQTGVYPKLEEGPQMQPMSNEFKLIQASKSLANGLTFTGKLISKGLQALGSFISKRVEPSEAIVVSPQTKNLIDKSVTASKKLLAYSTDKIANIFRIGKDDANRLSSTINQPNNRPINSTKQNLKIGMEAILNVYDGYLNGYDQAAGGLTRGTNQVISAKYGQDAGDVAVKLAEGALTLNKYPKIVNNALKQAMKDNVKYQVKKM